MTSYEKCAPCGGVQHDPYYHDYDACQFCGTREHYTDQCALATTTLKLSAVSQVAERGPHTNSHGVPHSPERIELDRVAQLLIDEWERVEKGKVNVSYIPTFVDMARVVIADRERDV